MARCGEATRALTAVLLLIRLALDNQALSASLEREEAARQEDKEGHEGALRQVQQELGAAGQRAARQEVELTGYKAQVRAAGYTYKAHLGRRYIP